MTSESYARGYRNGKADRLNGRHLNTARLAPDTEYARGYVDGNAGKPFPCRVTPQVQPSPGMSPLGIKP